MKFYEMTSDGYSVCLGACGVRRGGNVQCFNQGTIACDECGRYIPARGRNYKPTVTETVMSERGIIQNMDRRPTHEERRAFRANSLTKP